MKFALNLKPPIVRHIQTLNKKNVWPTMFIKAGAVYYTGFKKGRSKKHYQFQITGYFLQNYIIASLCLSFLQGLLSIKFNCP